MAELLLKVKDAGLASTDFKDGDILCAFNNRMINNANAQNLTNPYKRLVDLNAEKNLGLNSVSYKRMSRLAKIRYELSGNTITSFDLTDNEKETVIVSGIDVDYYMARRRKQWNDNVKWNLANPSNLCQQAIPLFGSNGSEVWFDGEKDFSEAKVDLLWSDIENVLQVSKASYTVFPLGKMDTKDHLAIDVDDFTDEVCCDLVAVEKSGKTVVNQRQCMVAWRDIVEISGDTIVKAEDRTKDLNVRGKGSQARANIVVDKAA